MLYYISDTCEDETPDEEDTDREPIHSPVKIITAKAIAAKDITTKDIKVTAKDITAKYVTAKDKNPYKCSYMLMEPCTIGYNVNNKPSILTITRSNTSTISKPDVEILYVEKTQPKEILVEGIVPDIMVASDDILHDNECEVSSLGILADASVRQGHIFQTQKTDCAPQIVHDHRYTSNFI